MQIKSKKKIFMIIKNIINNSNTKINILTPNNKVIPAHM
jgi:hypothetical protein